MSDTAPANPFGDSITSEDIVDTLGFFDSWEDRYRYIIDLGRELPEMPPALRTEDRYIHGCQSQVWIEERRDPDSGHLQFVVDSDAIIVRGLAAIVLSALNDRTPEEIRDADVEGFFARIDLLRHLSPTRGNGLRAMVQRIRGIAGAPQGA
jgi:cysteine desulfuration protein SufE